MVKTFKKKDQTPEMINWGEFGIIGLWVSMKLLTRFLTFITKHYPFSLLFTDKYFHAQWVGSDHISRIVRMASILFNNRFTEDYYDKDEYFYYVFGKFAESPNPRIFKTVQKIAKDKGLEIKYSDKIENDQYKFIAPVNQDWKWSWV